MSPTLGSFARLAGLAAAIVLSAAAAPAPARANAGGADAAVRIERPGPFFTAREKASRHEVEIPLPSGTTYRRVTITFRAQAPSFPGQALHSIVALSDPAVPRPEGRYFAMQHTVLRAAEKGVRTNFDNLVGGTSVTKTDLLDPLRAGRAVALRYTIVYDTGDRAVHLELLDEATGTRNAARIDRTNADEPVVEEDEISARGPHLLLAFGLDRIYDHGGYYPPYGWTFSDLVVELSGDPSANPRP